MLLPFTAIKLLKGSVASQSGRRNREATGITRTAIIPAYAGSLIRRWKKESRHFQESPEAAASSLEHDNRRRQSLPKVVRGVTLGLNTPVSLALARP